MRYLCLIYGNEAAQGKASEAVRKEVMDAYWALEAGFAQTPGVKLAGEALQPTSTATTVRVRGGKTQTFDGPFAETKEQLGGFYMIEAKNLDEAIKIAAKIPGSWDGSVEVRPIMEFNPPDKK